MTAVTVSKDYRITIPKEVRAALDLRPGQKIGLLVEGNHVRLVPIRGIDALLGAYPGLDTTGFREKTDRF